MTFLAMVRARQDLLAYFQAQLPAQIAAVNALGVLAIPLASDMSTYAAAPRLHQPETPALYVVPAVSGFRGTNWPALLQQQHEFECCIQVGHQDEETAMDWVLGYTTAVLNALEQWILRAAPLAHGQQLLFGSAREGEEANVIRFQSTAREAFVPFYAEAVIPLTVIQDEAP